MEVPHLKMSTKRPGTSIPVWLQAAAGLSAPSLEGTGDNSITKKFPFPPPGSSGAASPANSSTVRLALELWPRILPKPRQSLQSPNPDWCPASWDWEEARMGDTGWCTPTGGPWRVSRTKYILQPGKEKFSSFHSSTARVQHSQPAPPNALFPKLAAFGMEAASPPAFAQCPARTWPSPTSAEPGFAL